MKFIQNIYSKIVPSLEHLTKEVHSFSGLPEHCVKQSMWAISPAPEGTHREGMRSAPGSESLSIPRTPLGTAGISGQFVDYHD